VTVLGSGVVGDKKNNILKRMWSSSSFPGRLLNYEAAEKNGKISQTFGCHEEIGILERLKREEEENTVGTWRPIATVSEQRVLYYTRSRVHTPEECLEATKKYKTPTLVNLFYSAHSKSHLPNNGRTNTSHCSKD
jgi:hypothetical protein